MRYLHRNERFGTRDQSRDESYNKLLHSTGDEKIIQEYTLVNYDTLSFTPASPATRQVEQAAAASSQTHNDNNNNNVWRHFNSGTLSGLVWEV